jgi:hypothetical protein
MPFLTFPIDQSGILIDLYVALSSPRIDVLKASRPCGQYLGGMR